MVDGLIRLMDTPDDVTGPINLGNPARVHHAGVGDEGHRAWSATGARIEHRPLPTDDPVRRMPDIDLARDVLDWNPTVNLDAGLARTVDYFRGLLS